MDYTAIKAADAALSPPQTDPAAAAAALNAQTTTAFVDLPVDTVRQILAFSSTGDFKKAEAQAGTALTGTAADASTVAAHALMIACKYGTHFPTANATARATITSMMSTLQTANVFSAATVAAIIAAWTKQVSIWPRPITGPDIISARTLY